jgi:Chaperonin 10 Kd subunit.
MALKPAKGFILLKEKIDAKNTIILTGEAQRKYSEWIIESIGGESQFKKGDSVVFNRKALEREEVLSIEDGDKTYWICPESAIIATK